MTIEDIAKKFNINISTVSKALNGSTDIAESTRKAICEYAAAQGYKTRRAKKGNGLIAILRGPLPDRDDCFTAVIERFTQEAEAENYAVVRQEITEEFDCAAYLAEKNAKGVFLVGVTFGASAVRAVEESKLPAVALGIRLSESPLFSNVQSDDLHAAGRAVDYFISLGHNLIAFVGEDKNSLEGAERFAGYFFGLSGHALPYRHDLTYFGDNSRRTGENAAEYYLYYNRYFTAVVCTSRAIAEGLIETLRRAGRKIPEDISVIAFGDGDGAPVTCFVPDGETLAVRSFAALNMTLRGAPAQSIDVRCELKAKRATCAVKRSFLAETH
ncbi:MAG: LacI family transcriptional regulator [Clostridia bacterium]|nr:LacI family transcriptional regulator [Clostridia bacterium]